MADKQLFLTDEQLEEAALAQQNNQPVDADSELIGKVTMKNYDEAPTFNEELLFSWVAPERIFRPRRSKDYWRNLILLLVLIILLLIFTNQFYLLAVVLALVFLAYALSNVPPKKVRHVITNYGIYTHDRFYSWLNRGQRFWFETVDGQEQLLVETQLFPYRLIMLVGHERNKKHLVEILSHYLVHKKPPLSKMDRAVAWVREKFPLE
ncbi:MAG: hypothetical protein Q4G02_02100 [bacterium]|nr:hypothetical protein [bacterium]